MKIKHLTIATMATLMCLSSAVNVFATDNSVDDHFTNINYEVGESYKWQAPADLIFTKNIDNEVLTGSVSVLENIIEAGKTLVISIGPDEDFKLTSAEGAQRDYKVNKEAEVLSAGSKVLSVPSGTYDGAQDLDFELQGVVSGNTSQKAGIYTGTLNFAANIETTGSGNPGGSGGNGGSGGSGNTGGSGGSGGSSTVSVTKGQIVTLSQLGLTDVDVNSNGADTFRVLSVEGTNVKLLAMDSYKSAHFNSTTDNTYSGSTLDTEMTNYYNALPANVQNAIVEQNINQSTYNYSTSSSGSDSFSSWWKNGFTESDLSGTTYYLTRTTDKNVGNRKVYALDVDDVIAYLGSSSTPQDVNELFFNQRSSVSRDVWLRSAYVARTDRAFRVYGNLGYVNSIQVDYYECEVRPAFVLNLG